MFDDLKSQSSPSVNSGSEDEQKNKQINESEAGFPAAPERQVEDMFAETDKASHDHSAAAERPAEHSDKPPVFQPKSPVSSAEGLNAESSSPSESKWIGGIKRYTLLGAIVLSVIVVLSGGWYAYNRFFAAGGSLIPANNLSKEQAPKTDKPTQQANSAKEVKENKQAVKPITKPSDKDHDGLSDAEEAKLGTNPNNVDSDGDGLFDREEVKVYKTDPLNPDTDGDGFSDGEEVKKGYNPNGPGKLYKIKN